MDYFSTDAEKAAYQQRFVHLQKRQMLFFDKYQGREPRVQLTPYLEIPTIDGEMQARLNRFEAEHLKLTGRPSYQIGQEISARQEKYLSLLSQEKPARPPQAPRFNIGGVI
jgi:hypothetical protein